MSNYCELTGKKPEYGNNVSHSNRKTRTRWLPNIKSKKFTIPELTQTITLKLSTRAIRTIDKLGGLVPAIFKAKEVTLSPQLLKVKNQIAKQRKKVVGAKTVAKTPVAEKKV